MITKELYMLSFDKLGLNGIDIDFPRTIICITWSLKALSLYLLVVLDKWLQCNIYLFYFAFHVHYTFFHIHRNFIINEY